MVSLSNTEPDGAGLSLQSRRQVFGHHVGRPDGETVEDVGLLAPFGAQVRQPALGLGHRLQRRFAVRHHRYRSCSSCKTVRVQWMILTLFFFFGTWLARSFVGRHGAAVVHRNGRRGQGIRRPPESAHRSGVQGRNAIAEKKTKMKTKRRKTNKQKPRRIAVPF